jgi:hypothetical protein
MKMTVMVSIALLLTAVDANAFEAVATVVGVVTNQRERQRTG